MANYFPPFLPHHASSVPTGGESNHGSVRRSREAVLESRRKRFESEIALYIFEPSSMDSIELEIERRFDWNRAMDTSWNPFAVQASVEHIEYVSPNGTSMSEEPHTRRPPERLELSKERSDAANGG